MRCFTWKCQLVASTFLSFFILFTNLSTEGSLRNTSYSVRTQGRGHLPVINIELLSVYAMGQDAHFVGLDFEISI